MEPISIIAGTTEIPWKSIVLVLSVLAAFFLSYSLSATQKGGRIGMWVFAPFATVFSLFFCRVLYWYCNREQYNDFTAALRDHSPEGLAMLGILPGVVLAAALIRLVRLTKSLPAMLDALAPGVALGMGLAELMCLFDIRCRGKVVVTAPVFCHLPFAAPMATPQGGVEYRFATFFVSFLVLLGIMKLCIEFYVARREEKGCTAALFLLLYSASGFLLDSTRYDAGYFPFNGFVSVLQIFAGLSILTLAIVYCVRMLKKRGFVWYVIPWWVALLLAMGATGYLEYLVQRYGSRYLLWYSLMALSCLAMVLLVYAMYALGRKQPEAVTAATEETTEETKEDTAEEPRTEETERSGLQTDADNTGVTADSAESAGEEPEGNSSVLPAGLAAVSAVLAALGFSALLVSKKKED